MLSLFSPLCHSVCDTPAFNSFVIQTTVIVVLPLRQTIPDACGAGFGDILGFQNPSRRGTGIPFLSHTRKILDSVADGLCASDVRIFILSICLSALLAGAAIAENYSVVLPEFPRPATMAFPSGFRPASTMQEKSRHEDLMAYYRLNPGMKGNYEQAFLKDWQAPEPMPQIVVGTLGITKGKQGKISAENWAEIRKYLLQASQQEMDKVRQEITPNIMRTSPISEEIQNELVWFEKQDDPNSATILSHLNMNREGQILDRFSASVVSQK